MKMLQGTIHINVSPCGLAFSIPAVRWDQMRSHPTCLAFYSGSGAGSVGMPVWRGGVGHEVGVVEVVLSTEPVAGMSNINLRYYK